MSGTARRSFTKAPTVPTPARPTITCCCRTGPKSTPNRNSKIYADDVRCAHGTTVGQLDENAIFYLRSRGLDRRDAKRLLTHAFAADLVARAPVEASREAVAALVESRLSTLIGEEPQ